MNLWSHRFSQNTNKKLSKFLPSLHRAEILTFFCSYFGRNDDFLNSFWNCLTFRYMFSKCDSLNSILCRFFRDSYEEDKKSFEKTVTNIKTDIDCLFGLISSLDMQDKVTIFKSFSWTLCFTPRCQINESTRLSFLDFPPPCIWTCHVLFSTLFVYLHYEKRLAKNIRPTDILQIYTSI